jgi:formylglycine-generating enzyme required for sulfatase activity
MRSDNDLKMEFCWCLPGAFVMGSPHNERDRYENEEQVRVELTRGFWMAKHPVTQAQYVMVMATNPSFFTSDRQKDNPARGMNTSRFPVEGVSFEKASEFCTKLTQYERDRRRLPPGWEYRLPTEAQWEYACRAGTERATAFGDTLSSHQANFLGLNPYPCDGGRKGPYLRRPTDIGSYLPNAWGIHDMHGNLWQWCRDWYDEKLPGGKDPERKVTTGYHVARGGSWADDGRSCRSAARFQVFPQQRADVLGFRVLIERVDKSP